MIVHACRKKDMRINGNGELEIMNVASFLELIKYSMKQKFMAGRK